VPRFENNFNIASVRYTFELSATTLIRCRKLLINEQIFINCFKHSGDAPLLTIKKNCILFTEFICRLQTSCVFHHIQCLISFKGINWLVSVIKTVGVYF